MTNPGELGTDVDAMRDLFVARDVPVINRRPWPLWAGVGILFYAFVFSTICAAELAFAPYRPNGYLFEYEVQLAMFPLGGIAKLLGGVVGAAASWVTDNGTGALIAMSPIFAFAFPVGASQGAIVTLLVRLVVAVTRWIRRKVRE